MKDNLNDSSEDVDAATNTLLYTNNGEVNKAGHTAALETDPEAPDGGWGWVVCFACFVQTLLYDGIFYSFGIIFLELTDEFKTDKETGAWISSINFAFTMVTGPIISILMDRFGFRAVTIVGALTTSTGLIISSFATNINVLYVSYGILAGFGYGMVYQPSIVAVTIYFEKRRSFATGLSMCGNGLGIFILSPLTELLVQHYAWRGALLVQAGLLLNGMVCGLVYRPLTLTSDSSLHQHHNDDGVLSTMFKKGSRHEGEQDSDVLPETNKYPDVVIEVYDKDGSVSCLRDKLVFDNEETIHVTNTSTNHSLSERPCFKLKDQGSRTVEGTAWNSVMRLRVCKKVEIVQFVTKSLGLDLLRDAPFCVYCTSLGIYTLSYYIPYIYLPDVAIHAGIDDFRAAWLLSSIGITSIVSRLLFGFLADRPSVNRFLLYSVCVFLCGLLVIITPLCPSFEFLLSICIAYGLLQGIASVLITVLVADLLGAQEASRGIGVSNMFSGIPAIVGTPFAGWMYDVTGSYHVPFYVCGAIMSASGAMLFGIPCWKRGSYRSE